MSDEHDERAARILPCCVDEIIQTAKGHYRGCPIEYRSALAAEFRADAGRIERLWREINQYEAKPDEDGACLRCGLIWQEPDTTEKHICPPGFWREEEAELASLRAENERTQTALGQANADLMGCRDGALVRDLRAENERLRGELSGVRIELELEKKAANHWFKEANLEHNRYEKLLNKGKHEDTD